MFHLSETWGITIYQWLYALIGRLYSQAIFSSGRLVPSTLWDSSGQPGSTGDDLQPVDKLSSIPQCPPHLVGDLDVEVLLQLLPEALRLVALLSLLPLVVPWTHLPSGQPSPIRTRQAKPSYRRSLAPFFCVAVKYYNHSLWQNARGLALAKRQNYW